MPVLMKVLKNGTSKAMHVVAGATKKVSVRALIDMSIFRSVGLQMGLTDYIVQLTISEGNYRMTGFVKASPCAPTPMPSTGFRWRLQPLVSRCPA
jgi:hypothetical protein